jgi:hypothetical protein
MHASGEGIDAPFGALIDLTREILADTNDVFQTAERIRSWRI